MKEISVKFKSSLQQSFILLVVFLVFLPVLDCQFINLDDGSHLCDNRATETIDQNHLKMIFLSHVEGTYVPLTILSFAVERCFFGLNPFVFHLDNLILHLAVVALIMHFGFLCGLSPAARIMAAFLFGIHPMHVESVAWVTERKDVLYSFFYLLAMITYCYYLKSKSWKTLMACVLFGFLSLLAKPMAASLPLILFLIDWYQKRKWNWNVFYEKAAFFIYIVPVALITFILDKHVYQPGWETLLISIWSLVFYIRKFFGPDNFIPMYELPMPVSFKTPEYLAALGLCVFVIVLVFMLRKNRLFVFAWLYFICSVFLVLGWDPSRVLNIVSDRYMYLPSLGFCMLGGWAFDQYLKSKFRYQMVKCAVGLAVILALTGLMYKAHQQVLIWKDSLSFWNFVVEHNSSSVPYLNRAIVLAQAGKYTQALQDLNRSLALRSDYIEALNNRGIIYDLMGKRDLAIEDYTNAIQLQRKWSISSNSKSENILTQVTVRNLKRVSKHNLQLSKYLCNRGASYRNQMNYKNALDDLNEAVELNRYFPDAYVNRGLVYKDLMDFRSAEKDFSRAIKLNPKMTAAFFHRINLYSQTNDMDNALIDLDRVLAYDQNNTQAYYHKSKVLTAMGDYLSALDNLTKARSLGQVVDDEEWTKLQEAAKGK